MYKQTPIQVPKFTIFFNVKITFQKKKKIVLNIK